MKRFPVLLFVFLFFIFYAQEAFPVSIDIAGGINKPVKNFKQIKHKNVVSQTLDFSCGPASLATLLSYYFQDKVTEEQIIKALIITTDLEKIKKRKGFSLLDLKNFAKLKGYEVNGYKMDLDYLVGLNQPVLIPLKIRDYNHFVIFRGIQGDRVFIADPALGNMTMKIDKFLRLWQGNIGLVLSKSNKKNLKTPLKLNENERAVFADPAVVREIFEVDPIGKVFGEGEF